MVNPYFERDRDRNQQILRATPIVARSMYLELVRSGYSPADILRFVNKMLEYVHDRDETASGGDGRASRLIDVETGLPEASATRSIVAFECRRAAAGARRGLAVACVQAVAPDGLPREHVRELHERLARILWEVARSGDGLGRLDKDRYLLVPEGSGERALPHLARRLSAALAEERERARGHKAWSTVQVTMRSAAWSAGDTAESLIQHALETEPQVLLAPFWRARSIARNPRVVLALGGGAARAAAHVGVFRALQRMGVEIAGISGSSGGAIVGALLAAGLDGGDIIERFERFAVSPLLRAMRRAYASSRHNARDAARIPQEIYAEMIAFLAGPDRDLATLRLPFSATAADLVEGRAVELSRGSLHAALRASCAIPGLFPVQRHDKHAFVDGATISEVPKTCSVRRVAPEARVVSVYLSHPSARAVRYDTRDQLLGRMDDLTRAELVRAQLDTAEHLLAIPVEEYGWLGFREARSLANVGEVVASRSLPALLAADPEG